MMIHMSARGSIDETGSQLQDLAVYIPENRFSEVAPKKLAYE